MLLKKNVRKRKYIYRIYWKQIHLYVHPGSSKLCCPRLSIVKWLHNKAHQHDLMTSGTQVNARPSGAVLRMQDKGRPSRGLVLVALGQLHLQARLVWLVQCFKNNFFRAVHLCMLHPCPHHSQLSCTVSSWLLVFMSLAWPLKVADCVILGVELCVTFTLGNVYLHGMQRLLEICRFIC